jgi:hypothetical protein
MFLLYQLPGDSTSNGTHLLHLCYGYLILIVKSFGMVAVFFDLLGDDSLVLPVIPKCHCMDLAIYAGISLYVSYQLWINCSLIARKN